MAIPKREQRILLQRSGDRCAFPECRRRLTAASSAPDREGAVVLGEIAHIVAESPDGPRGDSPLTTAERNSYPNLLLLCNVHHQLIDDQPHTYPVERLCQMRADHEAWVAHRLNQERDEWTSVTPSVQETLYGTLLPVERMPRFLYSAPCAAATDSEVKAKLRPLRDGEFAPFLLHGGNLYVFQDLGDPTNPFADIAAPHLSQRHTTRTWWDDPDRMHVFVQLMNRAFNKLTGRRGLQFDRFHRRYYFPAPRVGQPVTITYQPLNQKRTSRHVVWQPIKKRTGEGRGYWFHRAVALRLLYVGRFDWVLSLRPELQVTVDGITPPPSEEVGRKVTRKKARMFNYDLLSEIQFWRDFLSQSTPRIILPFGPGQSMIISSTLVSNTISWPGMPEEHAKPFTNVTYVDDLFSWGEITELDDALRDVAGDDEEDDDAEDEDDLFPGG